MDTLASSLSTGCDGGDCFTHLSWSYNMCGTLMELFTFNCLDTVAVTWSSPAISPAKMDSVSTFSVTSKAPPDFLCFLCHIYRITSLTLGIFSFSPPARSRG